MLVTLSTPVRYRGERTDEGWIALQDVKSTYLDGAETWLYDMMQDVEDLSSSSTEMVLRARDWAERYHTDPSRSNVIRAFDIAPTDRVLEIGAGCGAVTRYLGERAALVDAVEPVPARARVARARTRDLANVEVFVGLTEDVPEEPTYDVVVVVGVLEYVGSGTDSIEPYLEFLDAAYKRLRPDGTLILAIENKLGVKYFAGAPEDHTGRLFDSLESYPFGGIARTFSRRELETLFEAVGFEAETRVAFPDYKLTRTVIDPRRATAIAPSLAHKIPQFPSYDWYQQRPRIVSEGLLWKSFVDAGLAADTGNSLVVVGRKPGARDLWSRDLIATYYSVGRNQQHLTETRVTVHGDTAQTERRLLRTPSDPHSDLRFIGGVEKVSYAGDFIDKLTSSDDAQIGRLLQQWLDLVAQHGSSPVLVDLIPQNLLVEADESLVVIDQEWTSAARSWESVRNRGLLRTGMAIALATGPARWPELSTVQDVVHYIAGLVDVEADAAWFASALRAEALLREEVACPPYAGTFDSVHDWWIEQLGNQLATRLDDLPLGTRIPEQLAHTIAELSSTHLELESFKEQATLSATRASELDTWCAAAIVREEENISQIQDRDVRVGDLSARVTDLTARVNAAQIQVDVLKSALDKSADAIMTASEDVGKEKERVSSLQRELTTLAAKDERKTAQVAHLETLVLQYQEAIEEIHSSTTWRLGRSLLFPLTKVRGLITRREVQP